MRLLGAMWGGAKAPYMREQALQSKPGFDLAPTRVCFKTHGQFSDLGPASPLPPSGSPLRHRKWMISYYLQYFRMVWVYAGCSSPAPGMTPKVHDCLLCTILSHGLGLRWLLAAGPWHDPESVRFPFIYNTFAWFGSALVAQRRSLA